MPTDEQLRDYARSLPPIYRDVLAAFPRIEPNRRAGYALAFQTIAADFESRGMGFRLGEIINACEQLRQHGLVEIKHRIFVQPTEAGERLIAAITGQQAPAEEVPALPSPPV